MAKTLIVYYSLEGNTEYAVKLAAELTGADVQKLIPDKEPPKKGFKKFMWGGKSVVFKEKPGLAPLEYNPDDYDDLIIAFPVWASSYPPAIASFIDKYPLKGRALRVIACSAGGSADKAFAKLKAALPDCTVTGTLSLIDPLLNKQDADSKITAFFA